MRQLNLIEKTLSDGATTTFSFAENGDIGRVTGSFTVNSATAVALDGGDSPYAGLYFEVQYRATLTTGTGSITIFGQTVPDELYSKSFTAKCYYAGAAWEVDFIPDFQQSDLIVTAHILDDNVTLAKMASATRGDIITYDSSGDPTTLTLGASARIMVSDGSDIVWVPISGDITISAAGAVTIAANAVEVGMIEQVAGRAILANDSTGSADLAAFVVGDGQILIGDSTGLASQTLSSSYTNRLDVSTSQTATGANTTETNLSTYTLPADTVDTNGHGLIIKASGTTGANANTKTLTFYIGSTTVTNGTTTAPNNLNWEMEAVLFRTGSTAQKGYVKWTFDGVADDVDTISDSTEDFTSTIEYKITGTNGTASANDIVLETWVVDRF